VFDNLISKREVDIDSECYRSTVRELEEAFDYRSSSGNADITGRADFIRLHRITKGFYAHYFGSIYSNYVPLYHSIWKMRLKDVTAGDNIHQDGGVYYFAVNGYRSRMITLWTNIYRDHIAGLSDSDMGLFVVDNQHPANRPLYDQLEAADTHFFVKRQNQLADNTYIGGKPVHWDISKLARTYFDYRPGTSITFNSHLMHGSKTFSGDVGRFSDVDLNKFRVSLTSVWLCKDDVAWSIVSGSERDYDNVYMSRVDRDLWVEMKQTFAAACRKEAERLASISALIKDHING